MDAIRRYVITLTAAAMLAVTSLLLRQRLNLE